MNEQKEVEITKFLLGIEQEGAEFLVRCSNDETCRELIEDAIPALAVRGDTRTNIMLIISTYGGLSAQDYEKSVEYMKRQILTRWDKCFINLMDELRAILAPVVEAEEELEDSNIIN